MGQWEAVKRAAPPKWVPLERRCKSQSDRGIEALEGAVEACNALHWGGLFALFQAPTFLPLVLWLTFPDRDIPLISGRVMPTNDRDPVRSLEIPVVTRPHPSEINPIWVTITFQPRLSSVGAGENCGGGCDLHDLSLENLAMSLANGCSRPTTKYKGTGSSSMVLVQWSLSTLLSILCD